jgi:hypothetical protein
MSKQKTRYYLVSYSHERGFGNIFFEATPYLDIRDAEEQIRDISKLQWVVILNMMEIDRSQYKHSITTAKTKSEIGELKK